MSFSYSSGVITQTGTDTNLSGLNGLTGVTTITPTDTDNPDTYELSGVQLKVQGTLSFNAGEEKIRFVNPVATQAQLFIDGGDATITAENTVNSITNVNKNILAIEFAEGSLAFGSYNGTSTPIYLATGSLTMSGTYIMPGNGNGALIGSDSTGTITFVDASLLSFTGDDNQQLRMQGSTSINMTRSEFYGMSLTLTNTSTVDTFDSVLFRDNSELFVANQTGSNNLYTFTGLDFDNAGVTIRHNTNGNGNTQHTKLINNIVGAGFTYTNNDLADANRVAAIKKVRFTPVDESGASVSASYYAVDTDNGNRGTNYTEHSSATVYTCATDNVYSGTGSDVTVDMIVGFGNQDGTIDNRGENADGDITFKWIAYDKNIATVLPSGAGTTQTESSPNMLPDASITESTKAIVDAYTEIETPERLYDRAKSYLTSNFVGQSLYVNRSGNQIDAGSYNVTIDATASTAFDLTGNLITIKASTFTGDMVTTGIITLANGAIFDGVRTDTNGTVYPDQPISITNISAGSRMRIYNVTTGVETVNTVVSGTSYTSSYQEGTGYNDGDTVRVYLTKLGKQEWLGDVIDTSNGFSVLAAQVDDDVYVALGVDGSTITKFQADYLNNEVDLIIGSDWTMAELYAWWANNLTTEDGIRNFFGGITAIDQANFKINTSIVDLYLDNTTNASYKQTDNRRFFRDTGTGYPVRNPTTSGYGLDVVWRNTILIAQTEGGTSNLSFVDVKRAVRQALSPKDKAVIIKKAR
jgi:hypothetical protein